jgi:hypothetical protein
LKDARAWKNGQNHHRGTGSTNKNTIQEAQINVKVRADRGRRNKLSAVIEINWTLTRTVKNGKAKFGDFQVESIFGRRLDSSFVDPRTALAKAGRLDQTHGDTGDQHFL